jgi:hypothetical protein
MSTELNKTLCQFSGGSAAQSTTFQIFDAVLGIVHPKVEGMYSNTRCLIMTSHLTNTPTTNC